MSSDFRRPRSFPDLLIYLTSSVSLSRRTTVLEVDCGDGTQAELLQKATKAQVFGVEGVAENLKRAEANQVGNVRYSRGDLTSIPFESNFFDFVYKVQRVDHYTLPLLEKGFQEVRRVLRPVGSKFWYVTKTHAQISEFWGLIFPEAAPIEAQRHPPVPATLELLEGLGFESVTTEEFVHVPLSAEELISLVENHSFEVLDLLGKLDYNKGLEKLRGFVGTDLQVFEKSTIIVAENRIP